MRLARTIIATATAALFIAGGSVLSATAASAAYEELRPGAESPESSGNSAWRPSTPDNRIAQPFIQHEDGVLATARLKVACTVPTSPENLTVAVHSFSGDEGPAPAPVVDGLAAVATVETRDDGTCWLAAEFPDRPTLTAGEHYSIIVDLAALQNDERPSFDYYFSWSPGPIPVEFRPWVFSGSTEAWSGYGNAHYVVFATELATLFGEPEVPVLVPAEQCGIEATVAVPEAEGVLYEQTREENSVTVTAAALEGYVLPDEAVTEWTFDVAAVPCPVDEEETEEPTPILDEEHEEEEEQEQQVERKEQESAQHGERLPATGANASSGILLAAAATALLGGTLLLARRVKRSV